MQGVAFWQDAANEESLSSYIGKEHVKEIWKPLSGYEEIYEISNYGQVRSLNRYVIRSDGVAYKDCQFQ